MNVQQQMGFESPGDQKVSIAVRDWNAMRLALWRSKLAWEIAAREATDIVARCSHTEGCEGAKDETRPCLSDVYKKSDQGADETDEMYASRAGVLTQKGCPDREQRMAALVILNAARMFAPINALRSANDPYTAPSREYFSEVLSSLATAQIELETVYEVMHRAGVQAPLPPPNAELALPKRKTIERFELPEAEEAEEEETT